LWRLKKDLTDDVEIISLLPIIIRVKMDQKVEFHPEVLSRVYTGPIANEETEIRVISDKIVSSL